MASSAALHNILPLSLLLPHTTHTHTHTLCTHSMRRVLLASITGANKHRQRATATLHGNQRGCPTNSHPPTSSTCIHTQAMPVLSGQSDFKAVQKRLFNLTISTCGEFVAYPPLHIQHTHTNMHNSTNTHREMYACYANHYPGLSINAAITCCGAGQMHVTKHTHPWTHPNT